MSNHLRASRRAAAFLLAATCLAGAAHAQETAPPAQQVQSRDQAADASPGEATGDVVVYARKRAENVQQVPIPVTVIAADTLTRQNLVNFTNFQTKFPAFSV